MCRALTKNYTVIYLKLLNCNFELRSSLLTFGSMSELSLHSLNCNLLAINNEDTLLSLAYALASNVVDNTALCLFS